jgi:hypothetical protein
MPTRRAMLASIAVLPSLGVAGQLSVTTGDPEWTRLIVEWRTARADMEAKAIPYNVAEMRYQAARPAAPDAPEVPKLWNSDGTANAEALQSAVKGAYRAKYAAYQERCSAHRTQCDALYQRLVSPAETEWSNAVDRSGDAARRVLAYPIRTAQQLVEKLDVLTTEFEDFGGDPDDRPAIIADVRRLAGMT